MALVKKGIERLGAINDQVTEELAWMMGRPTRYGGEFGGVNERTQYMAEIAAEGLADLVLEDSDTLPPLHPPRTARRGAGDRALELPLHDRDQHHRAGAHRRQQRWC